jgi:hypothetical protein
MIVAREGPDLYPTGLKKSSHARERKEKRHGLSDGELLGESGAAVLVDDVLH